MLMGGVRVQKLMIIGGLEYIVRQRVGFPWLLADLLITRTQ